MSHDDNKLVSIEPKGVCSDRESKPKKGCPNASLVASEKSDNIWGNKDGSMVNKVSNHKDNMNNTYYPDQYNSDGSPYNKGYNTNDSNNPYRFDNVHDHVHLHRDGCEGKNEEDNHSSWLEIPTPFPKPSYFRAS